MKAKRIILFLVGITIIIVVSIVVQTRADILKIQVSSPDNNVLRAEVSVKLSTAAEIYIRYQHTDDTVFYQTPVSTQKKEHSIILVGLEPDKDYTFQVIMPRLITNKESDYFSFHITELPIWLKHYVIPIEDYVPETSVIGSGFVHLYKRKVPGIFVLFDGDWNIKWYHQINGTGIKAATFTKDNTFLGVLGADEMRTAYGNEIIEVDISGVEKLRIKQGENGFNKVIHHDIFKTPEGNIATITVDSLEFDLSSVGGNKKDTVIGDGILVLDSLGNRVWEWSVFDVLNPLDEPEIINLKNDWVHANALNIDKDGNFLMSFYNLNQIWKINSTNGEIIWRLGEGGDLKMDTNSYFSNQHSVHINSEGDLMLFDNGTHRNISRAISFNIDEQNKIAKTVIDAPLPEKIFSARMGSAYLMENGNILQCSSKNNAVVVTNKKGEVKWQLNSMYLPYRAEYLAGSIMDDYYKTTVSGK